MCFGISYAQQTENNIEPGMTKVVNQELGSDSTADLNNVKIRFCNEIKKNIYTDDLSLDIRPWQKKEICMVLSNKWNIALNVLVGFAEAKVDEKWRISCGNDISYDNPFSKYIMEGPTTWIVVPASGNVIQRVRYVAPKTASGDVFGCVVYKINQEERIATGQMFLVVVRKIAPIYINITWSVYTLWRRDDIKYIYTDNKQTILKILIAILAIRLFVTIMKTGNKKDKKHTKKR